MSIMNSSPSESLPTITPPRYSTLAGAISPSAAAVLRSITASALNQDANASDDIAIADTRPPSYSSVFQLPSRGDRSHERNQSTAAGSSSSSGPQMHGYHIKSGNKKQPWATLKVFSRSSTSGSSSLSGSQKMPRFTSSDLVQGCLDLDLDSPQNINSICLSLRGKIITSSYEGGCHTFLDQPIVAWTRLNGDPRSISVPASESPEFSVSTFSGSNTSSPPSPSSILPPLSASSRTAGPSPPTRTKKFDGKLSGSYNWPFSFPFPTEITLDHNEQKTYSTPQTFLERGTIGNVQYELVLKMTHGLLRSDSKLNVGVVYVPDITPAPSSALRQVAYNEGAGIHGPDVDPFGWNTLPPIVIRGKLFNERNVKLQCQLSFANPCSYTRGSIIPLHLSIRSVDTHALDILANPNAIAVRLTRHVQYYEEAAQALQRAQTSSTASPSVSGNANGNDAFGGAIEDTVVLEKAVWWVPQTGAVAETEAISNTRVLAGEIHLEKEMQPSCDFLLFRVSYTVELLPFYSPVFKCSTSTLTAATGVSSSVLLSHCVTIATLHAEGPIPIAVTKPKPRKGRSMRSLEQVPETMSYSPATQMMIY